MQKQRQKAHMYKHCCMMCSCATKRGSTVSSEFAYYVPRTFNHTHVPYFSSIFEAYRTYIPYIGWYSFLSTVPSINPLKLINNDSLMTNVTYQPMLTCFCLYLICNIPKDELKEGFLKRVNGSTQGELSFCEDKSI